ncbi:glucose-1-phosphate cytidylyltransferase [Synechococcales cyanobacterium C]|uniref:Glucose-1-phosphate cytidylyltransferase n=1 Tax=Petrachloros mirabilis ULC683 TaxID=2781853 RepID=A0A8K2A6K9_9CYAN|nr:sugar phosphate nucleotidyltransferase [Petrachloros mirabilis]NCJ05409.1 glucose-1-phosphate cytidylyltransferase [Petrachloros mirabilis ULC683]
MKVVLFCGGLGTRLREYSETIPKPMVDIGYRPIIWHLMRYYAHFGHKDFILCLGYRGDVIKKYFLNYNECLSNNFVLSNGGRKIHLYSSDIEDWTITFVDTGLHANIGQRLLAVKPYLSGEKAFLANYADGLSDLNLDLYLKYFCDHDKIASFLAVQPSQSFHVASVKNNGKVESIQPVGHANLWINGGFFALKTEIFNYLKEGEELVVEPFQRLIDQEQLIAYKNPGFWACMDTLKEKKMFDDMYAQGKTPWAVWEALENTIANKMS